MSTESSSNRSAATGGSHAVMAGVIGAVVTIVLYWVNLSLVGDAMITSSGASITIIISTFVTGYLAANYSRT